MDPYLTYDRNWSDSREKTGSGSEQKNVFKELILFVFYKKLLSINIEQKNRFWLEFWILMFYPDTYWLKKISRYELFNNTDPDPQPWFLEWITDKGSGSVGKSTMNQGPPTLISIHLCICIWTIPCIYRSDLSLWRLDT